MEETTEIKGPKERKMADAWRHICAAALIVLAWSTAMPCGAASRWPTTLFDAFSDTVLSPFEAADFGLTLAPGFAYQTHSHSYVRSDDEMGNWAPERDLWTAVFKHQYATAVPGEDVDGLQSGSFRGVRGLRDTMFRVGPRYANGFPLGDVLSGTSPDFMKYEPSIIFSGTIPALHQAQLFSRFGAGVVQMVTRSWDPEERQPSAREMNWTAGMFVPFPSWIASLEFNANRQIGTESRIPDREYVTPGVTWKLKSGARFGVGIPMNVSGDPDLLRMVLKFTCRF